MPRRAPTTLRALTQAADHAGHQVHGHRGRPAGLGPGLRRALARGRRRARHRHRRGVGDVAKDSIVDSDKFKRVLAEDGVDSGSKTLGLAYIDVPSLVNLATAFGAFNDASGKEALDNLRHVGGVLFWTRARRRHGDERRVRGKHVAGRWSLTGSLWSSSRLVRRAPGFLRASPCRARWRSGGIRSSACARPSGRARSWPGMPITSWRRCCSRWRRPSPTAAWASV